MPLAVCLGVAVALAVGYLALLSPKREPASVGEATSSFAATTASSDAPHLAPSTVPIVAPTAPSIPNAISVTQNPPHTVAIGAASAVTATRSVIVRQTANVRAEPSLSGAVLRTVPRGTTLQVVQSENGWLRVTARDGEPLGWVHSSLVN
jgi:hypothetical protein